MPSASILRTAACARVSAVLTFSAGTTTPGAPLVGRSVFPDKASSPKRRYSVTDESLPATTAARCGVTSGRVRGVIAEGKLSATRVHRQLYLLPRKDVEAFASVPRKGGWPKGKPRKPHNASGTGEGVR